MRIITLILFIMAASGLFALGLDNINVNSYLYQPLNAKVSIDGAQTSGDLRAKIASPAVYAQHNLRYAHDLSNIRTTLVQDGEGGSYIRLISNKPMQEAYLDILLQLTWSGGNVMRHYTVLLDPPNYTTGQAIPVAAPSQVDNGVKSSRQMVIHESATGKAVNGTYGKTTRADSLWKIALKVKPDSSVNAKQTMIAIQRLNPHAFIRNNINGLMSGYELKLPTKAQIAKIDKATADRLLREHNQAWKQRKPLAPPPAMQAARVPQATPQVIPQTQHVVSQKIVAVEDSGVSQVKLNKPLVTEQNAQLTQHQTQTVQQTQSQLAVTAQALQNAKIANQLLKLKIQALQEKLVETGGKPVSEQAVSIAKAVTSTAVANTSNKSLVVKKMLPAKAAPTTTSDQQWLWWLCAIVLAFVGLFFAMRYRRNKLAMANNMAFADEAGQNVTLEQAEPEEQETTHTQGVVDEPDNKQDTVLDEVETYIHYGRFGQAQQRLSMALKLDPQQINLWEKLLEMHAELDKREDFEQTLEDIPAAVLDTNPLLVQKANNLRQLTWQAEQADQGRALAAEPINAVARNHQDEGMDAIPLSTAPESPIEEDNALEFDADTSLLDEVSDDNDAKDSEPTRQHYSDDDIDVQSTCLPESALNLKTSDEAESESNEFAFGELSLEELPVSEETPDTVSSETFSRNQLDMARAHIDMQDFDAARELLDAVLTTGTDEQREQAQQLLDELP